MSSVLQAFLYWFLLRACMAGGLVKHSKNVFNFRHHDRLSASAAATSGSWLSRYSLSKHVMQQALDS